MESRYQVGDVAILRDGRFDFVVRVINTFQDEDDGEWYCEVEPVEFKSIPREVPQSKLRRD